MEEERELPNELPKLPKLPNELDTPPGMEGVAEHLREVFMLDTSAMWLTGSGTPWPYPVEME